MDNGRHLTIDEEADLIVHKLKTAPTKNPLDLNGDFSIEMWMIAGQLSIVAKRIDEMYNGEWLIQSNNTTSSDNP